MRYGQSQTTTFVQSTWTKEIFTKFETVSGVLLNRSHKSKIMGIGNWTGREQWGTPLTCPREGVGTLVRGQKFTKDRSELLAEDESPQSFPRAGQGSAIPVTFHLLWCGIVLCYRSGFRECALLPPENCAQVTGMFSCSRIWILFLEYFSLPFFTLL